MKINTHLAVGVSTTLLIVPPSSVGDFILESAVAAVGSIMSDIDHSRSYSHKKVNYIVLYASVTIIMLTAMDFVSSMELWTRINRHNVLLNRIVAFIVLLIICSFGMKQPHRGFMHSLLALAATSWCMKIMLPSTYVCYCIGFASHILIDLFNKKGIQLLYPYRKKWCMKICSSGGQVNLFMEIAGKIIIGIIIVKQYIIAV